MTLFFSCRIFSGTIPELNGSTADVRFFPTGAMTDPKPRPSVDRQIDDNLKRVYEATASQPLPDKFLSLLAQLKAKESEGTANGK
jgi:hypothetical protein